MLRRPALLLIFVALMVSACNSTPRAAPKVTTTTANPCNVPKVTNNVTCSPSSPEGKAWAAPWKKQLQADEQAEQQATEAGSATPYENCFNQADEAFNETLVNDGPNSFTSATTTENSAQTECGVEYPQ
jgi:hypothetical protein